MNKLKANNRSKLIINRAKSLFKKIEQDLDNQQNKDVKLRLSRVLSSFRDLYSNLGKPSFVLEPFEGRLAPKSAKLNKSLREIEEDLKVAYEESRNLNISMVEAFNYAQVLSNELIRSSENASSKVVDLKLIADQLGQQVLIAGDDFKNLSKIDESFGLQNERADIFLDQGVITLKRISSKNIVDQFTEIKVIPVSPSNLKTVPTVDNIDRFYEGKFYDYIGSARPEGGSFHLEQAPVVQLQNTGSQSYSVVVSRPDPAGLQNTVNQLLRQDDPRSNPSARLRPEDIIIFDRGASEEEKKNIRKFLVDNNPSTFWECEYVKTDTSLQNIVDNSNIQGANNTTPTVNSDGTISQEQSAIVTLEDLRQLARQNTDSIEDDFVIDIVFTFQKQEIVNWISVVPNNFNETAWINVADISYAENNSSSYTTIPSFSDAIHDNTLTEDANAELKESEVEAVLAPTKFSYRGVGVWNFDPILAKSIKVRLKQKTAVPAPYQRLAIRLHRVFTQVYTDSTSSGGGL